MDSAELDFIAKEFAGDVNVGGYALDDYCDVYARGASTGRYDVMVKSQLPCHISPVSIYPQATAPGRDELATRRRMLYPMEYPLDIRNQIQWDGKRWNQIVGTEIKRKIYQRVDLVIAR